MTNLVNLFLWQNLPSRIIEHLPALEFVDNKPLGVSVDWRKIAQ